MFSHAIKSELLNMKSPFKSVAAAVTLALAAAGAHAQIAPPALGTTAAPSNALYLVAWNATTGATEIVNLGYTYSNIAGSATSGTLSGGLSNLQSATGPAWTLTSDPAGSSNQVDQLNFGTIANTSAGFTNYMVVSAAGAGTGSTNTGTASILGLSITGDTSGITKAGVSTVVTNVQSEINGAVSLIGSTTLAAGSSCTATTCFDINGSSTIAALNAPVGASGNLFASGNLSSTAVNSPASFYNVLANTSASSTINGISHGATATTTYAGYWFLSSTGALSYDILATSAVPVPAAVWLFGSGLLGMFGVGRRRRQAA